MERIIPNLKSSIIFPLRGNKNMSDSEYVDAIQKFERKCEKSLIETLSKVNTIAMTKTDPYSLPFTDEIVVTLNGESYMNGPYEFFRVARKFVHEILNKNLYKVRFYIKVDVITPENPTFFNSFGKVEYRLRYYNK